MTNLNITATTTITKATATELVATGGYKVTSTTKGVVGQFDKVIELIKALPQEGTVIIGAAKLKGVFKALGENSKDAWTFKQFIHSKGWELRNVGPDYTIFRQDREGIVLTQGDWYKQSAEEVVSQELSMAEEKEMVDYSHEYVPTRWEQIVGDELGQEPSKLPKPVYPIIIYTGEVKLPTVIQLGVVYSEVGVETDQGVKTSKFLYTNTGIITCKGTRFESVEALINAVKAAFKVETQEVSETTQQEPEKNIMKPKTFCQLMKEEWIPSKDTWEASNFIARMRATWKSGKYATDDRQTVFMKEFVEQVNILPQGIEMPNSAFLTAYEMVKEKLTGIKTPVEYPETIGKITDEEAVENFEADLPQKGVLTTGTIIPVQGVALPDHLKSFVVKQEVAQEEQDLVDHIHFLEESIIERCESEDELTQESVKADEEVLQELYKQLRGTHVQVEEKLPEDDEELAEGKVVIDSFGGQKYTIEVFFNKAKTLWINAKSGESFTSLYDLCMVQEKEYKNHQLFVNGQLVGGV